MTSATTRPALFHVTLFLILTLLSSLFIDSSQAEEVFKDVGEDGVPTFSDLSLDGSEAVEVRAPITYKAENTTPPKKQWFQRDNDESTPSSPPTEYRLSINSPENGTAVRENSGALTIEVSISPVIHRQHKAQLLMDGQKIRDLSSSGPVVLSNVDRGTHLFQVRVVNDQGNEISTSPGTSISMLRYFKRPGN
jgi:hypothetical protein